MKKWIAGTALLTLVAVPALAHMKGHADHKGPETRAEAEARIKAHFAEVDADKDGAISRTEADAFHAKMRKDHGDRMFARIDTDGNGQISRAEFDAHHAGKDHDGKGHDRMFTTADSNSDGKVTQAEALMVFDKADADKNGIVTPEERHAAMMSGMAEAGKAKDGASGAGGHDHHR